MQNNMCIVRVKLDAQKSVLSHTFTCRDICTTHLLRHRRHELARPLLDFSHIFVVSRVQICAAGKTNTGFSFQKVGCLTRSVSRNIALLEDKELSQVSRMTGSSF